MSHPEALGCACAAAIRNVRFHPLSGRVDVMLLPVGGRRKVVLVEAKHFGAVDAADKVVGQILKYYAWAMKLGAQGIELLRRYAGQHPEAARGIVATTPSKLCDGATTDEAWRKLKAGTRVQPEDVSLVIGVDGDVGPTLLRVTLVLGIL